MRLLVGDIGGTSTRLALASIAADGAITLSDEHHFPSASAPDLDTLVREWLRRVARPVTEASLAVAGPVVGNRCQTTNLPWHLDGDALAAATGLGSVRLLNDFAAAAWGTLAVSDAARVSAAMRDRGVVVRSFHSHGGALTRRMRVTVGTPAENDRMLEALRASL